MVLKVGLLISDDPDDYQIFLEAIDDISKDIIVVNIGNGSRAIRYLKESIRKPDFVIIDLSMNDVESASVFRSLVSDPQLSLLPKMALVEDKPLVHMDSQAVFVNKSTDYTELKKILTEFLSQ